MNFTLDLDAVPVIETERDMANNGVRKVTRDRLNSTDHYRMQVNADPMLVAVGYGLCASLKTKDEVRIIRNQQADRINNLLSYELKKVLADPKAQAGIRRFLQYDVEPELRAEVEALWRKHGWTG